MEVFSMNKLFYPALFHKADEGGYWISFPDFPECLTEGDTMEEAYEMAFDALGLALSDKFSNKEDVPAASSVESITVGPDSFVVLIEFDKFAYNRKHNSRAVKKTLSIPEWLNEEAIALGVNFSQVLQEALLQKITK